MNRRVAIIRIRGKIDVKKPVKDTLAMLRLYKKNSCVIVPNTPVYIGMLKKVKDYVTWGEVDEKAFRILLERRGRLAGNKSLSEEYLKQKIKTDYDGFVKEFFKFKNELKDIPGLKLFFRLKPPEKGFERKGIKKPFSVGGALGYRKDDINNLIKRMI